MFTITPNKTDSAEFRLASRKVHFYCQRFIASCHQREATRVIAVCSSQEICESFWDALKVMSQQQFAALQPDSEK